MKTQTCKKHGFSLTEIKKYNHKDGSTTIEHVCTWCYAENM
jgi:hypothetical protein